MATKTKTYQYAGHTSDFTQFVGGLTLGMFGVVKIDGTAAAITIDVGPFEADNNTDPAYVYEPELDSYMADRLGMVPA